MKRKEVYAHVLDETIDKINDKSESFIFIGYDSNSKGYKSYNPNTNITVTSQDVEFNRQREWDFGSHFDFNFFPHFEEKMNIK